MLFRPFRLQTCLKLGFIGWLAGAGSSGSFNYSRAIPAGTQGGSSGQDIAQPIISFLHDHMLLVAVVAAFLILIFLGFLYLSCRFRFILFDSVLRHDGQIARGWTLYARQANRFFAFMVCFMLASTIFLLLVVGLPLWLAYKRGIFQSDNLVAELWRLLIPILFGVVIFVLITATVSILANDFVLPLMALGNATLGRAWSQVKEMALAEPGAFAGYLGMKPILSIAGAIAAAFAMVFVILLLAIPAVILVLVLVAMFKNAGAAVMLFGVLLAAIGILVGFALLLVLSLTATALLAVFLTSYSLYFFAGRYPPLAELLWPQPPEPLWPPAATPPPPFPGAAPAI
jgi:hypothetical protein